MRPRLCNQAAALLRVNSRSEPGAPRKQEQRLAKATADRDSANKNKLLNFGGNGLPTRFEHQLWRTLDDER
jgi:hypothetical protein